jgi:uncharacterized protein (TIGR03435 family)
MAAGPGMRTDMGELPSVSGELQKFGLKLERSREMFEYLVVDSGDKTPTEN